MTFSASGSMSRRDSVCSERGRTIGSPTFLNYTKAGPGTGSMASMKLTIPQQLASVPVAIVLAGACFGTPARLAAAPVGDGREAIKPERPDPMARARELYNQGHYEGAMESATTAKENPFTRDAALLILGRAGLE